MFKKHAGSSLSAADAQVPLREPRWRVAKRRMGPSEHCIKVDDAHNPCTLDLEYKPAQKITVVIEAIHTETISKYLHVPLLVRSAIVRIVLANAVLKVRRHPHSARCDPA